MHIARLDEKAVPVAAEVIRQAFSTVADAYGLTEENCPAHGAFLQDRALVDELGRGAALFGLFAGGELAGVVALRRRDADILHLEKLAVLPWAWGKGYGCALVAHAVEAARRDGGGTISIGVMYENRGLVRWYERRGFVRVRTEKRAHLPFVICFMERTVAATQAIDRA